MVPTEVVEKWQVRLLEASEYQAEVVALVAFPEFPAFAAWLESAPFELGPYILAYITHIFYAEHK